MAVALTGVLAGAVHSGHPGTLLTGRGLLHAIVDDVDQGKLLVVPQHVSIDVIIDAHALCRGGREGSGYIVVLCATWSLKWSPFI